MRHESTVEVTESQAGRPWPERQLKAESHQGTADMMGEERNRLHDKVAMEFVCTTPQRVENMKVETPITSASKKTIPSASSATSWALRKKIGKAHDLQRRQRRRRET